MSFIKDFKVSPYTKLEDLIDRINSEIELEKDVLDVLPIEGNISGILIPNWPITSLGREVKYEEVANGYAIKTKGGILISGAAELDVNGCLIMNKNQAESFVFSDFNRPFLSFYVLNSGIGGINRGDIVYVRQDIRIDTIVSLVIGTFSLSFVRKEYIAGYKKSKK
jgi:hypothetical protein